VVEHRAAVTRVKLRLQLAETRMVVVERMLSETSVVDRRRTDELRVVDQ
jgi:hypothetical protein